MTTVSHIPKILFSSNLCSFYKKQNKTKTKQKDAEVFLKKIYVMYFLQVILSTPVISRKFFRGIFYCSQKKFRNQFSSESKYNLANVRLQMFQIRFLVKCNFPKMGHRYPILGAL